MTYFGQYLAGSTGLKNAVGWLARDRKGSPRANRHKTVAIGSLYSVELRDRGCSC